MGAPNRPTILFSAAAVVLLTLFVSQQVHAGGQKEDQLATAQQLIDQKRYDDAILILTDVMKHDPQDFERAQSLLNQINKARNSYNDLVAQLVTVFNQGDLEKAYLIIKQLEDLDKAPNAQTVQAQAYARQTAAVVYNTERFHDIMNKAAPMLKSGDYAGAMTTYLGGLDLGLDIFQSSNYGNIIVDKVDALRSDISAAAQASLPLLGQLRAAESKLTADIDQPAQLPSDISAFTAVLDQVVQAHQRIVNDTTNLKIQRESILIQRSSEKDVPLVTYIEHLVTGREDIAQPEGMLVAIDEPWESLLTEAGNEIMKTAEARFSAGQSSYANASWDAANESFDTSYQYALLATHVMEAWSLRLQPGTKLSLSDSEWKVVSNALPRMYDAQALAASAASYEQLIDLARTEQAAVAAAAAAATASAATPEQLSAQRTSVAGVVDSVAKLRAQWSGMRDAYTALASSTIDMSQALARVTAMNAAFDRVDSVAQDTVAQILVQEAALRYTPVTQGLAAAQDAVKRAESLLNGVPAAQAQSDGAAAALEKYPDQAQQILTTLQSQLQGYDSSVAAAMTDLKNDLPNANDPAPIQGAVDQGSNLRARIASLSATVSSDLNLAQQGVFQANRYEQEGRNFFQQAQAAVARNDFTSARQYITSAADSLDKSLSFQENASLRSLRDNQLPDLSKQITDAQNTVVVRDVRDLINQGKQYYSQGNYTQAQDVLLRAQARWRTTNSDDDSEISTWLQFVDTAINVNSGRNVAPTDPLYPEITQILNLAESDYQQAQQFIATGKSGSAQQVLTDAQKKLLYVQVPFPLNAEARVLSLKILRLTDPNNFDTTFKSKFQQAVNELSTNPQDAYITIKDLQAIQPGYPGLANALDRAEILTGIKRPPPDPAKIQQSDALYQKAFDIVRSNVRAQFPIALTYLNQAIELNPNNEDASALKDRIAIDTGADTTVVLSNADQIAFTQAQEDYVQKSYFEALRIVNQLLQNPQNQSYTPLIELKRRIESKT